MHKIKLETKCTFEDFLNLNKPHYHMNWDDDKEPKSYPCILVYNVVDNPESYMGDLYYTFVYQEELK